jgi:four helix bundle protein
MKDFRNLTVWRKSHGLTLGVYRATNPFSREEIYGLTSQLRKCAASIGANIAEGCGRGTDPNFGRFLSVAMGSASELEYHLLLAYDLGYLNQDEYEAQSSETTQVKRMLASLITRLRPKAIRLPAPKPPNKIKREAPSTFDSPKADR